MLLQKKRPVPAGRLRASRLSGSAWTPARLGVAHAAAASLIALALSLPGEARAWGAIGHRMATETAAILLEDEGTPLGELLARHRFELGVYSFLPDMAFRESDGSQGAVEAPLHFLALDALGDGAAALRGPWDAVAPQLRALDSANGAAVGRLPWRTAQLFDLARSRWAEVARVDGRYQPGATSKGDTARVFEALYFMGVMAHYSADAAVPHHATSDSNSFRVGQGGLHFYFEGPCVDALEPDLSARVLARARRERTKLRNELGTADGPIVASFRLLADSAKALGVVERIDRKSALSGPALEPGSKAFANRKPPHEACKAFASLIEERLAKAAVFTAELWKQTVPEAIDWTGSRSLQFSDLHASVRPAWPEDPAATPAKP